MTTASRSWVVSTVMFGINTEFEIRIGWRMTTPSPMTLRSIRVPGRCTDVIADQTIEALAFELDQVDREEVIGPGQIEIALDDRMVMDCVTVVDQDLDAVGNLILVPHRRPWRAADRVEDVRVEHVQPTPLSWLST